MKTLPTLMLTIVFHLIFGLGITLAQAPEIEWQKSLGGSFNDGATSISQTTDGGYIMGGYSLSNDGDVTENNGSGDYWVVKLNQTGNIEWQKSMGGSSFEAVSSIKQTQEGGYIIAGTTESNNGDVTGNHGGQDYWIVKLDAVGNMQWHKSFGGSSDDYAESIEQTEDAGYIVAGYSASNDGDVTGNNGSIDYWIVKLSSTGDLQWQKSLGGSNWDFANSIKQTSDGGYIVAGSSGSNNGDVTGNNGGDDFWIAKLNEVGNLQWQKSLGGSGNDFAQSIVQTADGGYIIAGQSDSNNGDVTGNHGEADYWIVKLNIAGELQWQKSLGGSLNDGARNIQQTPDGGYVIAGHSNSNDGDVTGNHGETDYWVVKLNTTGELQWQKSLGGSSGEAAYSIKWTSDGGYIIAGLSGSTDGDISGNQGSEDCWIVKLEPDPLSLNEFDSQINIFPNPVSSVLNISANEPIKSVSVYNQLGQEVMASSHFESTLQLDMSGLPSSLYFVEITTDKSRESFKIIVN